MARGVLALLHAYRRLISPLYGPVCRYWPSCSAYAVDAVSTQGAVRGGWLAVRRVGRCHPWNSGGIDVVPPRGAYTWWGRWSGSEDLIDDGPTDLAAVVGPGAAGADPGGTRTAGPPRAAAAPRPTCLHGHTTNPTQTGSGA